MPHLSKSIIEFMKRPDSYPHRPEKVEHIQTHISHVFISSPFVYKIKKPLDLGFLDFSTLEKRKNYCYQELELNRRLCNDIYLDVIKLVESEGSYRIIPGKQPSERTVEYAVKMKQLKRENFLIGIVKNGDLKKEHIDRVARKLHRFYSSQSPDADILEYGDPEKIRYNTDENFDQTRDFIGKTISHLAFHSIHQFTNSFLDKHEILFRKRIDERRIVDGHGDLHLEHINLTEDSICIYDCIEFNERFRYQDIAADLAFLAMDFDFHHQQNHSRYFINLMSDLQQDPELMVLADFYKCYRAYVRGKVKSFESDEEEISNAEQTKAAEKAGRYFRLSLYYALFGSKPVIYLFMGRVASGKSTLAKLLANDTGISNFSTDILRKELAGIPLTKRLPDRDRTALYSENMSDKTYQNLCERGVNEIQNGRSVILDGTFASKKKRRELTEYFEKNDIEYVFVESLADKNLRQDRLRDRNHDQTVISDARLNDMDMLDERYENPDELDPIHYLQISTSGDIEFSLKQLYSGLIIRNIDKGTR
jgi:uncharacterized protein